MEENNTTYRKNQYIFKRVSKISFEDTMIRYDILNRILIYVTTLNTS